MKCIIIVVYRELYFLNKKKQNWSSVMVWWYISASRVGDLVSSKLGVPGTFPKGGAQALFHMQKQLSSEIFLDV